MKYALLVLALIFSACSHTPPNLSPAGASAFQRHEIQRDLDLVRDVAIDAQAQMVLSEATTRKIVMWHRSAITIMHNAQTGWVAAVTTSLDELVRDLPPDEAKVITAYVALVKTVLAEVQS